MSPRAPGANLWRLWPFSGLVPGFRELSLVATGGMGEVYTAKDRCGTMVAIKILREDLRKRVELVERFEQEVEIMLQLRHVDDSNCFVDVRGHGLTRDGRPFVVMEYLRGESLKELLAKRGAGLEVSEAVDFVIDVCVGLDRMHRADIVHRDLTLNNLFAVRTPRSAYCKILDFGIAKVHSRSRADDITTEAHVLWGVTAFMPPERLLGASWDPRFDVYSLGVVLYTLLANRVPFFGTKEALAARILQGEFEPLNTTRAGLPHELVQTVHKAMARDASERHRTVGELFGELARFASLVRELPAADDRTAPTLPEPRMNAAEQSKLVEPRRQVAWAIAFAVAAMVVGSLLVLRGGASEVQARAGDVSRDVQATLNARGRERAPEDEPVAMRLAVNAASSVAATAPVPQVPQASAPSSSPLVHRAAVLKPIQRSAAPPPRASSKPVSVSAGAPSAVSSGNPQPPPSTPRYKGFGPPL